MGHNIAATQVIEHITLGDGFFLDIVNVSLKETVNGKFAIWCAYVYDGAGTGMRMPMTSLGPFADYFTVNDVINLAELTIREHRGMQNLLGEIENLNE